MRQERFCAPSLTDRGMPRARRKLRPSGADIRRQSQSRDLSGPRGTYLWPAGSHCMKPSQSSLIELDLGELELLDQALKLAYRHLIETGALRSQANYTSRDLLVRTIVNAIRAGETNKWGLARLGIFAVCAVYYSSEY
jgi:hypothetical protein